MAANLSFDGPRIAVSHDDDAVRVWSVSTVECEGTFTGHSDLPIINRIVLHGALCIGASSNFDICVWDAHSGALIWKLAAPVCGAYTSQHSISLLTSELAGDFAVLSDLLVFVDQSRHITVHNLSANTVDRTFAEGVKQFFIVGDKKTGAQLVSITLTSSYDLWNVEGGGYFAP